MHRAPVRRRGKLEEQHAMRADDVQDLTLPAQLVTNAAFPYDGKLAAARSFMHSRGITDVRPLYGTRPKKAPEAAPAPTAEERALARWFDVRCA